MTFQVEFATQPKVLNVEFDTALNISGGYDDGYNDGFSQGKSEGLTEGEEIGYNKGSSEVMQDFVNNRGLQYLYYYAADATDDSVAWLEKVDLSLQTNARSMFQYCTKLTKTPQLNLSNVINLGSAFSGVSKLITAKLHAPKAEDMDSVFYNCTNLVEVDIDTSSAIDSGRLFTNCHALKTIPTLDLRNATDAYEMFSSCSGLEAINIINTNKLANISQMFNGCKLLKTLPTLDFSGVTNQSYTFGGCEVLETISFAEGSFLNCTNMSGLFNYCKALHTVSPLDIRNATGLGSIFYNCSALTNLTLKNIKTNLQVGSGTTYGHLLTLDSLIGLCYELRDTGSSLTLTVGSANLEKLANVYVREIPITDAMREADDLIDEKLPFEVCESTADGATLITDYVLLKNWKLA